MWNFSQKEGNTDLKHGRWVPKMERQLLQIPFLSCTSPLTPFPTIWYWGNKWDPRVQQGHVVKFIGLERGGRSVRAHERGHVSVLAVCSLKGQTLSHVRRCRAPHSPLLSLSSPSPPKPPLFFLPFYLLDSIAFFFTHISQLCNFDPLRIAIMRFCFLRYLNRSICHHIIFNTKNLYGLQVIRLCQISLMYAT